MEITNKGYIGIYHNGPLMIIVLTLLPWQALFNATSLNMVLSNDDFFVGAQHKQDKGNLILSTYSSARLYKCMPKL